MQQLLCSGSEPYGKSTKSGYSYIEARQVLFTHSGTSIKRESDCPGRECLQYDEEELLILVSYIVFLHPMFLSFSVHCGITPESCDNI